MRSIGVFVLKARQLRNVIYTLYLASKDPRVPLYVKILMLLIVAYALSPVDNIPDFIPILGYIDDLIILREYIGDYGTVPCCDNNQDCVLDASDDYNFWTASPTTP